MANEEHLAILKKGVSAWNEWRKQHPDIRPNLDGADLRDAKLIRANLFAAHLGEANLIGASLINANLGEANLPGANLIGALLCRTYLGGACLKRANLSETYLERTNFGAADVTETDFTKAILRWTVFADVDLSTARGLETVRHEGPSSVGVDTIYRSQGKIPKIFLRGAGLPDEFIAYIGSFVHRPRQFYSCFISYSTKDQEFADRVYESLQNKGVRCWFAPHDIQGGRKIHEQLDEAIRVHDKLLLILSEHSMSSDWVGTEIANAREREAREGKQLLFPISIVPFERVRSWKLFDADRGKDSAREIREYFIPDFSNWKDHDSFQKGFEKLVNDLKSPLTEAKSPAIAEG